MELQQNEITAVSMVEPLGLLPVEPVAKVTAAQLITEYGCAKDTNRARMLTCLGRNFGKQVTRAKLLTAVYGSDDLKNKGGLAMLLTLVKARDLPYVIVKRKTTIGLYPVVAAVTLN